MAGDCGAVCRAVSGCEGGNYPREHLSCLVTPQEAGPGDSEGRYQVVLAGEAVVSLAL